MQKPSPEVLKAIVVLQTLATSSGPFATVTKWLEDLLEESQKTERNIPPDNRKFVAQGHHQMSYHIVDAIKNAREKRNEAKK